jgi:hypothetical protein
MTPERKALIYRLRAEELEERLVKEKAAVKAAYAQFNTMLLRQIKELIDAGKSFTVTRIHDSWDITVHKE